MTNKFQFYRTSGTTAKVVLGNVEISITEGLFSFGGMTKPERRWFIGDKTFQSLSEAKNYAQDQLIYDV